MKSGKLAWANCMMVVVALCGCGGPALVPVEGVVTLDGRPLAEATVTFQRPTAPLSEKTFAGETDSQGHFALRLSGSERVGAVPDNYRVFITSVKLPPGTNEMTKLPPERVPVAYRDGSQTFEVPAGGTTEAKFVLSSK